MVAFPPAAMVSMVMGTMGAEAAGEGGGGKGAGPCAPNDADASSTVRCTRCGTCATRERHGAQRRTVRARGASRMLTVLISPGPETARVWHDDGARTACTARRRGAWPVGEVSHPTLARGRASRTCSRAAPATQADSAEGSAGSSAGSETQVCAKTARTRAVPGLHSRFELGMPLESHDNGCYGRVTRAMRDARHRAAGRPPRAAAGPRKPASYEARIRHRLDRCFSLGGAFSALEHVRLSSLSDPRRLGCCHRVTRGATRPFRWPCRSVAVFTASWVAIVHFPRRAGQVVDAQTLTEPIRSNYRRYVAACFLNG